MNTLKPCLLLLALFPSLANAKQPNILFLYTDDHSYRTISCYEHAESWARTPNIDRLAKRGVRFTHAYIGTWCMPSRVTMLTGRHQYGAKTMRMEGEYPGSEYDPAQCPFWPAVFRQHGYHTAHIGKWHSGRDSGFGRDWDHQVVWNRPKYPANAPNYYHDQLLEGDGAASKVVPGYSTDNYTRWAIDYINGANRDKTKPWYLWLCYGGVHAAYTPAERHLQDYPGVKVATPADIYPPRAGKPSYMQKISAWEKGPNGEPVLSDKAIGSEVGDDFARDRGRTLSEWSRQYHQAVRALDEGIGKVLAALEESGQLQNTLVVLTADQGYAWGQHGFRAKLAPYDANIRSPLIVSMPGTIPEGKICRTPVGGADLPPTFFRFAGLDLPWTMHGHDLTPLLQNPDAAWPHTTIMPFTADKFGADCDTVPAPPGNRHKSGVPWYVMLAERRFKYIRTLEANEPEELYDLQADPEELNNLASDPRHAESVNRLRAATIAELKRTGAKMVDSLPPVLLAQNAPLKKAADLAKKEAPFAWVSPLTNADAKKALSPTVRHATFKSPSMGIDVGYYIYLPPGYETSGEKYPVVYHLHGGRPGAESKSVRLASYVDKAIVAGTIKPTIYVFPNGGPVSWYDMPEMKHGLGETVFVKELIPHIDATYRTWGTRAGRALEGYSQGGRGTTRIMFKHPELFLSVAPGGSGYGPEKRIQENNGYESDMLRFLPLGYNAWDLAKVYAARKDRPPLSILVWDGTKCFNYEFNIQYSAYLKELGLAHEFLSILDVPHTATGSYDVKGNEIMRHHQKTFDAHRQGE